jgi:hypothetical protein
MLMSQLLLWVTAVAGALVIADVIAFDDVLSVTGVPRFAAVAHFFGELVLSSIVFVDLVVVSA